MAVSQIAEQKQLQIKKSLEPIKIDGILNESAWLVAEEARDFSQSYPYDTAEAKSKTIAKVCYDNNFLYVGAICYDSLPGDYVITSLKRDWSYPISDAFVVTLDPFNDKTNGFSFGVNPMGAQREGLVANNGMQGVSTDWDNRWYSHVTRAEDKWVVEMAIPFKTLRFKEGITSWGVNFSRNDLKCNENSCWAHVPRQFNISSLAFVGNMLWETPPEKNGANVSIIPYGITRGSADYTGATKTTNADLNFGLDAKVAVTSSLNLDVTINPDFSQVEVDRQVVNLTRFSLFFPERRNFFIENSDLFSAFGFSTIRPFFSRRIGLDNGKIIPILGGLRLSGKINKNWRIGLMNLQTKSFEDLTTKLDPQNYTVLALQRQLFTKSNISFIFINRSAIINKNISATDYNRVAGFDYNLVSKDNKIMGKTFFHYSFNDQKLKTKNYSHAVWLMYNSKALVVHYNHELVGDNFITDVGFVPRLYNYDAIRKTQVRIGFWRWEHMANYRFYPKSSIINFHGPGVYFNQYNNLSFVPNDQNLQFNYQFLFQNQSTLRINQNNYFTRLYYNTDITQSGSNTLVSDGKYYYRSVSGEYVSTKIKKLNGTLSGEVGSFYIGKKYSVAAEIAYRIQPYGTVSLRASRDQIVMPVNYNSATLVLFGPTAELAFTRKLFFTTNVQYNTQLNNVNIYSRLQWRFKPMSDLFIVYNDNYDAMNFTKKSRALVIKFVYWFSV